MLSINIGGIMEENKEKNIQIEEIPHDVKDNFESALDVGGDGSD